MLDQVGNQNVVFLMTRLKCVSSKDTDQSGPLPSTGELGCAHFCTVKALTMWTVKTPVSVVDRMMAQPGLCYMSPRHERFLTRPETNRSI